MSFLVFYVARTFRAAPVVKKRTTRGKSIDSKDPIRLCFHEKSEETTKNSVVVSVHRKGFLLV